MGPMVSSKQLWVARNSISLRCNSCNLSFVGHALIDLMQKAGEEPPKVGEKVLCRHPFQESKRAYVIPSRVEPLYKVRL